MWTLKDRGTVPTRNARKGQSPRKTVNLADMRARHGEVVSAMHAVATATRKG